MDISTLRRGEPEMMLIYQHSLMEQVIESISDSPVFTPIITIGINNSV